MGRIHSAVEAGPTVQGRDDYCVRVWVDRGCGGADVLLCGHREQGVLLGAAVHLLRPFALRRRRRAFVAAWSQRLLHAV